MMNYPLRTIKDSGGCSLRWLLGMSLAATMAVAFLLSNLHEACAQDSGENPNLKTVTTYNMFVFSHEGIGAELSPGVMQATQLIKDKKFVEGAKILDDALAKFEILMKDKSRTYVCFMQDEDFQDYMKDLKAQKGDAAAQSVTRVEASFGISLQMKAFMASDAKKWSEALEYLEKEIEYCPYDPQSLVEMGYIFHVAGKNKQALEIYDIAARIGAVHHTPDKEKAKALRGQASTLIDLGNLDDAESIYKDSLKLDPDSQIARDDLEYIKKVRALKK
jgi:tetratricopeptide (TPR) repeat protein